MAITWSEHSGYTKELKALQKTFRTLKEDVEKVKRLIIAHFFVEQTKNNVIGPGKIHRVMVENDNAGIELWKVEVIVHNTRSSLWPRLWFMIDGENIMLLAIASHKTNYDNNEIDRTAISRYRETLDQ